MSHDQKVYQFEDLEYKVVYSRRRTIGISVHPDSSVFVRVPYLTSMKTITKIVNEKYDWVIKHRDNYRNLDNSNLKRSYADGESHLFMGKELVLKIERSNRLYVRFHENLIEIGIDKNYGPEAIRKILYAGYKIEAGKHFPLVMNKMLTEHQSHGFKPTGLVIRTMKRRWGSCSSKGLITLSTELIKLSDLYIEYVILHELCHLRHHNHGPLFYKLLSEVFPEWKAVRKELRRYIQ
jgi:predicted metal-dependent hydrolase